MLKNEPFMSYQRFRFHFLLSNFCTLFREKSQLETFSGHFCIPSFASKLLLKEVICKKNVKNVFFQQNQVHIAIFASKRLSCKMYNSKTVRFSAKCCK